MEYTMPRKVSFFNKNIFSKFSCCCFYIWYNYSSFIRWNKKNYWFTQISESAPENIVKALVANKYDLFDKEEIDKGEASKLAEKNNTLFF